MNDKKQDFFSNLFSKKTKSDDKRLAQPFDENYFTIESTGGTIHTQAVCVRGITNITAEEVKLRCQWFLISNNNDITPLTQGDFYQPNIEDAGHKIMVQVEPLIEGREYQGMPKSIEVGPLQVDLEVQDEIDEFLDAERLERDLTLMQIVKESPLQPQKDLEIPCPMTITLTLQDIEITINQMKWSRQLGPNYPNCCCDRSDGLQFTLNLDEMNSYKLKARDSIERDVIITVIKTFYAKGLCADLDTPNKSLNTSKRGSVLTDDNKQIIHQQILMQKIEELQQQQIEEKEDIQQIQEESILNDNSSIPRVHSPDLKKNNQSENINNQSERIISSPDLKKNQSEKNNQSEKKEKKTKMDFLLTINENAKLKQENQSLLVQIKQEKDQNQNLLKKISDLGENLTVCTRNYYNLEAQCNKLQSSNENLQETKIFLLQDNNLYKAETIKLKDDISNIEHELKEMQKRNRRQALNQDLESLKEQISVLNEQMRGKDLAIVSLNEQIEESQVCIQNLDLQIEDYQNELSHERKRNESISLEIGIIQQNKQVYSYKGEQSSSDNDLDKNQEIARLKQANSNLESTIRSLKFAYDQNIRNPIHRVNKDVKQKSTDIKFIKNLANQLSEIITDKETALENQKQINRNLMQKIESLSNKQ